jgi:hypothetical protein
MTKKGYIPQLNLSITAILFSTSDESSTYIMWLLCNESLTEIADVQMGITQELMGIAFILNEIIAFECEKLKID